MEIKKLFKKKEYHKEIFHIIKKKFINNVKGTEEYFKIFKTFFNISESKENKELIDDLTILFSSKQYELDLKSMIYFFDCLNKDGEWSKKISKKYDNLSKINLKALKEYLDRVKKMEFMIKKQKIFIQDYLLLYMKKWNL